MADKKITTLADWRQVNGGHFTEDSVNTRIFIENPSMELFKQLTDSEDWDEELTEHLAFYVVNDVYGDYAQVYLVSDNCIDMNIKPSKKRADRLIAFSYAYSDKWTLVESMEINYNRETGLSTMDIKIGDEAEPIKMWMS